MAFNRWEDRQGLLQMIRHKFLPALPAETLAVALAVVGVWAYQRWTGFALLIVGAAVAAFQLLAWQLLIFRARSRTLHDLAARLERQAVSDQLTGLGNRRALIGDLEAHLAGGKPWTLALFDLDGFKHFNDTFGHGGGDELLVALARELTQTLPVEASAYRLGGDEFYVLLSADRTSG